MPHEPRGPAALALIGSLLLHVAIVAGFLALRPAKAPPSPPIYRVQMVAAPPGPRAIGAVNPDLAPKTAPAPTPAPTPPKVAPRLSPKASTKSAPAPKKVTPAPSETRPNTTPTTQKAGGGPEGGTGTDVATVNTGGIDFPFPGYLENIVRQVALRFDPSARGAVKAEVAFIIRRDGSVPESSIRLTQRSGVYSFDLEAQGAIEAAANAHAFGPLPKGFPDDALPVIFRFDPRGIH